MDREAWSAAIHGVVKSWTQLSDWSDLIWMVPQLTLFEVEIWESGSSVSDKLRHVILLSLKLCKNNFTLYLLSCLPGFLPFPPLGSSARNENSSVKGKGWKSQCNLFRHVMLRWLDSLHDTGILSPLMLGSEPTVSFFFSMSQEVSPKDSFDTDGDHLELWNASIAGVAFKLFFK